ncbi:MAG: cupin domain-containing protein [Phycisphaerales bacterium]
MPDSTEPLKHAWSELPVDAPMPLIRRQRVIGERMMISRVTLAPQFTVPSHAHENEQFVVLLSGRCRFGLGPEGTPAYREVIVVGGEVLHLPPNLPHSCVALEETIILDLFSPTSAKTGVDRA